jgi:CRP/FNR family transcriptional regulator
MALAGARTSVFEFQSPAGAMARLATSFEGLFDRQPVEWFDAGESIFFEGDPAKHIFEVTEGVVRLCKILVDGRRIVTGFLFAGDIIGVSQAKRFIYSAEAVGPVKLRRVTRRSLDEAVEASSTLRPQVFAKLCEEMAATQEQMVLLSCKNAEERVCSFLASLMKRTATSRFGAAVIELPMSRLDIADFLGMTIETVSRNLTKLAKKGVLAEVERFSLRVLKPQLLEELAGIWTEEEDEQPSRYAAKSSLRH